MTSLPDWTGPFAELQTLDPAERRILELARVVTVPPGEVIFRPGMPCEGFLLVLEGCVRVAQVAESGREIVLFRIGSGEACILTVSCLMSGKEYTAEAVVEEETRAVVLPAPAFHQLLDASAGFRRFVLGGFGARIIDLTRVVDAVAFHRIDQRLAELLVERADCGIVVATHHELARELGSAREVVSRQLKEMERRGLVSLDRGRLELRDLTALRSLAGG